MDNAVDNFDLIIKFIEKEKLLENQEDFLFLQIIQRKKDFEIETVRLGRNNNNRLIRAYYIYNVDQLKEYKNEIIALCKTFNARAGINLNKRNNKKIALRCLELIATALRKDDEFKGVSKIYNTACGKESESDRLWIVDLDKEDLKDYNEIFKVIEDCKPNEINKILTSIPSKSGLHLITKRFDRESFSKIFPKIEIHTNNPTNIFIP